MASQKNRALQAKLPKLQKQKTETSNEIRAQYVIYDCFQRKFYQEKLAQRARLRQHF